MTVTTAHNTDLSVGGEAGLLHGVVLPPLVLFLLLLGLSLCEKFYEYF